MLKGRKIHHRDVESMELLDEDLHDLFTHTGTFSAFRNGAKTSAPGFLPLLLIPHVTDLKQSAEEGENVTESDIIESAAADVFDTLNRVSSFLPAPTKSNSVTYPRPTGFSPGGLSGGR